MDLEKWKIIKGLFSTAIELAPHKRGAILEGVSSEIRLEVEQLLAAHEENGGFIEEPAIVHEGLAEPAADDPFIGKTVGNYLITEKIGSGGMGLVFLAERKDFAQKVAVKLIKRGMDSEAILKRFYLERQILSRLNHPNIAHLIDGGMTDEGQPYLVMEFVEGRPLLEFCALHKFSIREKLELFRKICTAVSFAHQNLIVHRDIKPSNVLITNDGTPKLLDFGIAKLLDADAEGTTAQIKIFTPEYASPEQLNGLPITTSTDVYSLGVVLYELLSGVRPFNSSGKSYQEIARMVLTEEPARPSSVVGGYSSFVGQTNEDSTPATNDERSGMLHDPHSTFRSLKGDIDNIILKAIRKDPERRYASVQELSEDLRRNLAGLPVSATADSRSYRFRKFVGRHKLGTAALALVLLLSGIAVSQSIVANRERARAERRLIETRKIANSLMFEVHDSLATLPGATASREILVKRAMEYLDALHQEGEENPELMRELAIAYRKVSDILGHPEFSSLGKRSDSLLYCQKAFDIHSRLLDEDPLNLDSLRELGSITETLSSAYPTTKGDWDEGLKYARISQKTLATLSEIEPTEARWKSRLAKRYNYSAFILESKHDHLAAAEDYRLSLQYTEEAIALAPDDPSVLVPAASVFSMTARRLGDVDYNDYGRTEEALVYLERALAIRTKLFERDPNNVGHKRSLAVVYDDLGVLADRRADHAAANEYFSKALVLFDEIIANDPKDIMVATNKGYNLMKHGHSLSNQGRAKEALGMQKRAVALHERWVQTDPDSVDTITTLSLSKEHLADTMFKLKSIHEARSTYEASLGDILKAYSLSKSPTYEIIIPAARLHLKLGKLKGANTRECTSAQNHFKSAYKLLDDFRQKDRLSPTNTALYEEIKTLADTFTCIG